MLEWNFEIDFGSGFQSVPPPRNWKGIIISILFIDNQPNAQLSGLDLEWVGETARRINQYRDQGLVGGKGIYEGLGLRITPCPGETLFDGYIDLASESTRWECDTVTAPCVEKGRTDWINDVARGVSFAVLATLPANTPGRIIPATDYKKIPYCVSHIPDWTTVAMLAVSNVVLVRELRDMLKEIPSRIQDLQAKATTAVATLGAAIALIIAEIIKTVLYILYLAAIILALITMVKEIITNIFQLKKYKLGMREEDCFKRICQYFGLGFSSTIYASGSPFQHATHVPAKNIIPSTLSPLTIFQRPYDEGVGFPNNPNVYGHPDENCGDFIARMCQKYNAGVSIINNTLHFEEVHYWNTSAAFQIPNTGEPGNTFNLPHPSRTNASELASDYYIAFATDATELNTIHRYKGTSCEVKVKPITVGNIQRLSQQRGVQVLLPEALAKRKNYLSKVEKFLNKIINALFGFCNGVTGLINGLLNVISQVISVFGGNTTGGPVIGTLPTNILNTRLGWMEITNDTFAVPKTFIGIAAGSDWKISSTSEAIMSGSGLMQYFHGKNLGTRGNQQLIYDKNQITFCCSHYSLLRNRNVVLTPNNLPGRFRGELKWDLHNEILRDIEYSEYRNFTNNLQETIIIDGK